MGPASGVGRFHRFRPEFGESFIDLDVRIRPAFEELVDGSLVVCHGHVIRVLDRVIMEEMSAWEFSLFNPIRGDIPNGALIEYKRDGASWCRRQSVPHTGVPPATDGWRRIVPIRRSNEQLSQIIERVLKHVRSLKGEAAE